MHVDKNTVKKWRKLGYLVYDAQVGLQKKLSRRAYIQYCFDIYFYGGPFRYDLIKENDILFFKANTNERRK
jgi:hypothetical protein